MTDVTNSVLEQIQQVPDDGLDSLATYVGGLSILFQLVEDLASDTDTDVGWSLLLDIDRCPDYALPWLAQTVGVVLAPGLSAADQRQQISGLANWQRGTINAFKAAPAPYLTGAKTVIVRERQNPGVGVDPYHVWVVTYTAQTPDSAAVLAALESQKPAGIILHYETLTGQDFLTLKNNYATFALATAAYPTFADMADDTP